MQDVQVKRLNLGYYLESADQWWDVVWNGGFRGIVEQIPSAAVARFREEHLQEIQKLVTADGLWLNIEVLHGIGARE